MALPVLMGYVRVGNIPCYRKYANLPNKIHITHHDFPGGPVTWVDHDFSRTLQISTMSLGSVAVFLQDGMLVRR